MEPHFVEQLRHISGTHEPQTASSVEIYLERDYLKCTHVQQICNTTAVAKMPSPHFDQVKEHLRTHPDEKWGFTVYRCTYGDNEAWERMMSRLRLQAQLNLEARGEEDLYPRIDWAVQENPTWDGEKPAFVKE